MVLLNASMVDISPIKITEALANSRKTMLKYSCSSFIIMTY